MVANSQDDPRKAVMAERSAALYSAPSDDSIVLTRIQRDEAFEILAVDASATVHPFGVAGSKFIKIRDSSGREGYIDGSTKMSVRLSGNDLAVFNESVDAAVKNTALKKMLFGGVVCAVGIVLTVLGAQGAFGDRYIIFYGAILYGAYLFLKGLVKWLSPD